MNIWKDNVFAAPDVTAFEKIKLAIGLVIITAGLFVSLGGLGIITKLTTPPLTPNWYTFDEALEQTVYKTLTSAGLEPYTDPEE